MTKQIKNVVKKVDELKQIMLVQIDKIFLDTEQKSEIPFLLNTALALFPEKFKSYNFFTTKIGYSFESKNGEDPELIVHLEGQSSEPENWSTEGLLELILEVTNLIKFSENFQIISLIFEYGKPFTLKIEETPALSYRSFDLIKKYAKRSNRKSLFTMSDEELRNLND